ncbi:MAG: hypothetical protein ACLFRB_06850 [Thiohalorhabdus sp.]|uniref:hypothetical protein n=1 Tax=Thiohalorhabdus sp. TaxID=3094134 RepID=UPI00397F9274
MSEATYTVYSLDIADMVFDPASMEAYEDLHGESALQDRIREAAGTYADALREAFAAADLDVEVEVRHNVTGAGSGVHADNAAEEDRIQDVANQVLEDMETLEDVRKAMAEHDRYAAPGSESAQWQAYVEAAREATGTLGYDEDEAPVTLVTPEFAHYWHAVARGDYATAEQYGEVPEDWKEA